MIDITSSNQTPSGKRREKPKRVPKYGHHKGSGQAVVHLNGRSHYLGKYGSPESKQQYDQHIAEWLAHGRSLPHGDELTVCEVLASFWTSCKSEYATSSHNLEKIRVALRPVRELYGRKSAYEFDALALNVVRQHMIDNGLARRTINMRIGYIKECFRWAGEHRLVPVEVAHSLQLVKNLRKGRSNAKEAKKVRPVPDHVVEATLPYLPRHARGLIELQRLTGARSGELCIMRLCDIDRSGDVWIFTPEKHKNEWRDKTRQIFLGPRAKAIIREFMTADPQAYLFSPRLARDERYAELRKNRKSKVPPSQKCRRNKRPKKLPGEHYTSYSLRQAVHNACELAFPLPEHLQPRTLPNGKPESKRSWQARLTDSEKEEIKQ